jgi:uncharacterized protein with FMN-binding domain
MSLAKQRSLRRVVLAPVGTGCGIVLMLALKPSSDPALAARVQAERPAFSVTTSAPPSPSAVPTTSATTKASPSTTGKASRSRTASSTPTSTSGSSSGSAASTTRSFTGATVSTKYGPVQVEITTSGGRITGASALKYPTETAKSQMLSAEAVPVLNRETLQAQSANIDTVSGATYTSEGYRQSLQSALDAAGL